MPLEPWCPDPTTGRIAAIAPEPTRRPRPTQLPPALGDLAARGAPGGHHARRLSQELVQLGSRGSERLVRLVVRPWRPRQEASPPALTPATLAPLLLQPAGRLIDAARDILEGLRHAHPLLARGDPLNTRVQTLLAERDPAAFDQGLKEADTSNLPAFHTVARSFRQDDKAIQAARTTPWSTGQGEGQMCRVKLSTRLGYGRAKLDLLRQRILQRRVTPIKRAGGGGQVQQPAAASRNVAASKASRPLASTDAPTLHASSKARESHDYIIADTQFQYSTGKHL